MKIAVLIKQVPSSEARIRVAADGCSIEAGDVELIVNPYDEYAMEAALEAKEKFGGEVAAFALGGVKVEEALRTCLALGADRAVVLRDAGFVGSDPLGAARVLAAGLLTFAPDLVLCGKLSIDEENGAVGAMVAELLDFPHVSVASHLDWQDEHTARVKREIEGGTEEVLLTLPAVVTANKGLNEPRYASLKGIMMAKKKPLEVLDRVALGLDATQVGAGAAGTTLVRLQAPADRSAGRVVHGDSEDVVAQLLRFLKDEAKAL